MKILVVGAGAVGGYYGAMLARAGHTVMLVARGEHGRALQANGIVVETPEGELTARPPVVLDVRDAAGFDADVAIVAVKAASLSEVASAIGATLGKDGVAIPLLNGLDSEQELARVIGPERVIGAVAQIAARIVGAGRIRVEGPARIVLAPLSPEGMPLAERIAAAWATAGFECDARKDLARVLWTKLLWNAPFNAICALTQKTAGEVLAVPELAELVREAMRELSAVARAEGVTIDERAIDATLEATKEKFADSVPSMLQDVRSGRATEARALQGAVVARGTVHGISTPLHRALLALVLGRESPHT